MSDRTQITVEILEHNGFKLGRYADIYEWVRELPNPNAYIDGDGYESVRIDLTVGWIEVIREYPEGTVKKVSGKPFDLYVDELQTAMRLCGIDKTIDV
jgi:hypothetical protein